MFRALAALAGAFSAFAQSADYDRGVELFQRGSTAEAIPFLKRAAEAHPDNAQMWKAAGAAYAAQKQYALAEPAFRRACQLDPKLQDACYFHARALYALDRHDDSMKALEMADPRSWRVRLAKAQTWEALGEAGRAEREFQESIAQCRGARASPEVGYGLFLLRQGRTEEAIRVLEEAVKRFEGSAEAHTYLGRALVERGRDGEAIPHLERAVALAPASAQAHLLLAKAYVHAGRSAEAQAHFDAAAKRVAEK